MEYANFGRGKMKENWKNGKAPRMKFLETDEGGSHADEGIKKRAG